MPEVLQSRSRTAAKLLALLAALGVTAPLAAQDPVPPQAAPAAEAGVSVDSVEIRGNERLNAGAVRTLAGVDVSRRVTAADIQRAIRRLMTSGNFNDVQVYARGDLDAAATLVIEVAERPLVGEIDFQGLERISARTVRDTAGLRTNAPLDPNAVVRTERVIREMLAEAGVQVESIDTTLTAITRPENSYRLTFRVREGQRLSIADVEFLGNDAFSDGRLIDEIGSKPEGFLWFRTGRYNPETLRTDLRARLPEFYGSRGYIDFEVISDTLVVDPQSGKARIVVTLEEGPQYRLGEFNIEGASRFPTEQLSQYFTSQSRSVLGLPFGRSSTRESGEVFDQGALSSATQRVQQLYRNQGYLGAEVQPVVERAPAAEGEPPRVDVTWQITERTPFYIDRINIAGNTYTHESVIRDRLFVLPGDIYSDDRLLQSYQNISALGFFEAPMPTPDILPNQEAGTVDVTFHVQEKQTGNISFGTMIGGSGRGGGLSGFLGYSQPNLFGQAKRADLRGEYGYNRNSFQASYTDPALFGTRNSGSLSLFHYSDRFSPFSDGRRIQTGASVRYGFPLPNLRYSRAFVGYSLARSTYQSAEENCDDLTSIFCLPAATASTVSFGLTRDTRDGQLFPTVGTSQSLSVEQSGGPLGGDGEFQKVATEFEWWVPAGRLGGSAPGSRPIRFALGMQVRVGTVFGDVSRFPLERFYLGGTQSGEQLRGYEEATLTPFGYSPRGGLGARDVTRLGDAFLTVTSEYAMRVNDNLSLSIFGDAGNIWTDAQDIDPTRLFRGAGVGVTVVTPFGPLGLDYAYGFDKDEPGWQFHFKLGQGF